MTPSTIESAYELARSGRVSDFAALKAQLKADGCRAVEALLAPRGVQAHLQAICAASFRAHSA
jgi:type II secretory pathway component PulL